MANSLSELSELAKESGSKYPRRRALFGDIVQGKGKAFTGIVGPRGVGKTVLLRQLASEVRDSFYISADTLGQADLFETAKTLARSQGVRLLLLDEVHEAPDYASSLKRVYDFLDLRVVFTSSVALQLLALEMSVRKMNFLNRLEIADHGVHPDSPKNVSKSITVD